MPRSLKPASKARHDPLHVELRDDAVRERYGTVSKPGKRQKKKSAGSDDERGDVS